ncbi:chromodomain Y-like protein isoform X3 [Folsomia candida]|uniref:Chromobox protein 5 n=1 Tax=Folsomia candida TaxID=158441 RepID=A0A226EMD2_FOLCA|nr:chromodomain Y-like protein isoform X3 [Folsomia candida]OXA58802.1 Chromobox protein 5 [Folsomia candida]
MVKSKKSGGGRKGKAVPIKAKAKVVEEEEFEEEEEQGSQDNGKDDHDDESSEPEENDAPPAKRSKTTTPAKKGKAGPASSKKGKTEPAASKKGKAGPASKTKQPAAANKGRPKKSVEKPAAVDSESDDADSDTDYEVDSLLDVKYNRNGTKEFLVKWIGYPKSQATWEPEGNLNCPEKLEAFSKKLDAMKQVSTKSLRTDRKQTQVYQDSTRNKGVRTSRRFANSPRTTYHGQDE